MKLVHILLYAATLLAASACSATPAPGAVTPAAPAEPVTLVVATHDSFAISEPVVAAFEAAHNARVQFLTLGDAGAALNKIILSKDAPLADVFFGVDNTFLSRALAADIFTPHASPLLDQIPDELKLDPEQRLLPVDYGYVTLNADPAWFAAHNLPLPATLEDLADPAYRGLLVVQNPATSSPGLAFLLTTVAHFGEDGYQDYWQALRANDVLVTDGWSEAYFERFTVGSGGAGDRPLVVSYSTSPPADVVYATDGRTEPASVNLLLPGGAFQQVEFAGVLAGAKQPKLAQQFVDYMLDITFQEDIPLQMFVYPANTSAALPALFTAYAQTPADPVTFDPAAIEAFHADGGARGFTVLDFWRWSVSDLVSNAVRGVLAEFIVLLAHQDRATLDPLNLDQWRFYVLSTAVLNERKRSQHSITLPSLAAMNAGPHKFDELRAAVEAATVQARG